MDKQITIKRIQEYVKTKDHKPEIKHVYVLKFMEECGELARAINKNYPHADGDNIRDTIEEEFCDVLFYLCALANLYDVDMEKWFPIKQLFKDRQYKTNYTDEFFE